MLAGGRATTIQVASYANWRPSFRASTRGRALREGAWLSTILGVPTIRRPGAMWTDSTLCTRSGPGRATEPEVTTKIPLLQPDHWSDDDL